MKETISDSFDSGSEFNRFKAPEVPAPPSEKREKTTFIPGGDFAMSPSFKEEIKNLAEKGSKNFISDGERKKAKEIEFEHIPVEEWSEGQFNTGIKNEKPNGSIGINLEGIRGKSERGRERVSRRDESVHLENIGDLFEGSLIAERINKLKEKNGFNLEVSMCHNGWTSGDIDILNKFQNRIKRNGIVTDSDRYYFDKVKDYVNRILDEEEAGLKKEQVLFSAEKEEIKTTFNLAGNGVSSENKGTTYSSAGFSDDHIKTEPIKENVSVSKPEEVAKEEKYKDGGETEEILSNEEFIKKQKEKLKPIHSEVRQQNEKRNPRGAFETQRVKELALRMSAQREAKQKEIAEENRIRDEELKKTLRAKLSERLEKMEKPIKAGFDVFLDRLKSLEFRKKLADGFQKFGLKRRKAVYLVSAFTLSVFILSDGSSFPEKKTGDSKANTTENVSGTIANNESVALANTSKVKEVAVESGSDSDNDESLGVTVVPSVNDSVPEKSISETSVVKSEVGNDDKKVSATSSEVVKTPESSDVKEAQVEKVIEVPPVVPKPVFTTASTQDFKKGGPMLASAESGDLSMMKSIDVKKEAKKKGFWAKAGKAVLRGIIGESFNGGKPVLSIERGSRPSVDRHPVRKVNQHSGVSFGNK